MCFIDPVNLGTIRDSWNNCATLHSEVYEVQGDHRQFPVFSKPRLLNDDWLSQLT